jgi:hypothetical protein
MWASPPPKLINRRPPVGSERVILGTREQVINPEAMKSFAIDNRMNLAVTPGDHFFHGRGKRSATIGEGLQSVH